MSHHAPAQKGRKTVFSFRNGTERTHVYEFGLARLNLMFAASDKTVYGTVATALRHRGFGTVADFEDAVGLRNALCATFPDLLICDQDLADGDVCEMIRRLRHQNLGPNPFALVVMLLTDPSVGRIRRAIDAGSDDIVVAPASVSTLFVRFMNLVARRKPFVVTADYIGPTRRERPRPGAEQFPLIEVPNSARLKMQRDCPASELQRMVDRAALGISRHKREREAVQLAYRVEQVRALRAGGCPEADLIRHLRRIVDLARNIDRQLSFAMDASAALTCRSVIRIAESLIATGLEDHCRALDSLPALAGTLTAACRVTPEGAA